MIKAEPISAAPLPADLLMGRVILVTGAGDGLGRATAIAAAACGAELLLLGRTAAKLEKTYDAIVAAGGPEPAILPVNLLGATWADYQAVVDTLETEFGRLDGLVHCAAHFTAFAPLETLPPKDWMDSLQVNLTAPYTLTRLCLPLLTKAADASIVFVTETAARRPRAFRGAYGLAKFALEGLVKMWAEELSVAPNLRVNSFDPGPMNTLLRRRGYPSGYEQLPTPEAAAQALVRLLGPETQGQSGLAYVKADGAQAEASALRPH